jgi:hypothetical protein
LPFTTLLARHVAQVRAHVDLRGAADLGQVRQDVHVLDVDRVDLADVDLAQQPPEVPPAAGAVPVEGRRPPVREVAVAAQRRDLHDQRVAPLAQPVEVGLEREVARVPADRPAVEPDLRADVGALEADLPERALELVLGHLRDREFLAVPAHRCLVELGVARVPVVRDADRLPADEVVLGVPALDVSDRRQRVVGAEVPGAAQQLTRGLPFVDQGLAARRLHHERRRRLGLRRRGLAARRTGDAALRGRGSRKHEQHGDGGQGCQDETQGAAA